jgi:dynein heavy chain 1
MNMNLQGIALVWESYKLDPYVQRLAEVVFSFQEKVEDLLVVEEQLDVDVRSLETCPYSANTFADILGKIQHAVDDLSLRQYSNLHIWVTRLDEEVNDNLKNLKYCLFICVYYICKSGMQDFLFHFVLFNEACVK